MEALMDWKSMGSLYASLMFVRGAAKEVVPPEVYRAAKTTFFYFFTNLDNDIFNSVRRYLSSKCFASSKSLQLSKIKNLKKHTYTMVPDQSMSLHSDQAEKESKSKNSTSIFKLCFEEKYKEFVDSSYTPHWLSQVCQFSHPSTFDTIAMDPVLKQEIKADLKKFVNKYKLYTSVGAWKRGYLLYSPPGTGNNRKENNNQGYDEENKKTISTNNGTSSVSLSGILNFVDGLWSPCAGERLIILRTNHKEKLDPALLRSGRMDKHISLPFCNMESFKILAKNYLKVEEHELMKEVERIISSIQMTPADVAECFMSYDEDPDMGMRDVKRLRSNDEENKELKRLRSTGDDPKQDLERTIPLIKQEEKRKEEYENEDEEENDYAY
ncbi:hypothetical protein MKX01_006472 [Papaver californicum]|nr:hypothetical protein MKX01_006472 [Papaver californicum]